MISSDDGLVSPEERDLQRSIPSPAVETTPRVRENDPDEPPVPVSPKKVPDTALTESKRGVYTDTNVSSTGRHTEPGSETTLNDTSIKTVKVIAKGVRRLTADDPLAGSRRTRKRAVKKTGAEKMDSEAPPSPSTELSAARLRSDCPALSQSSAGPSSSTPKRGRGRPRKLQGPGQSSTPDRSSFTDNNLSSVSASPLGVKREEEEGGAALINHSQLSAARLRSECPALSQSSAGPSSSTPKRGRGRPRKLQGPGQSSTPDRSSFTDNNLSSVSAFPLGVKREEEEGGAALINHSQTAVASPCSKPKAGRRPVNPQAAAKTRGSKRAPKGQSQGPNDGPPAKHCRGRKGPVTAEGNPGSGTTAQPPSRDRPRFEPLESISPEQGRLNLDETSLSSDLSIELSQQDELSSLPTQEEAEDEEDEEELPSFLIQMDKRPPSITEGICVWCKFRNYPFWPAVVKSVNRKLRKASIMFIDDLLFDKKRKGLTVALKTLKPFDCEDADQLVCKAKEKYNAAISWCQDLIADYRIRIGCGSFTGSFIEYFADDISCPVRRKYPQGASAEHAFPSKLMMEEQFDLHERESFTEQQEKFTSKKLLPDRTHAARKRFNEKLVQYIVKQRMVERRLLAVISGQQQSRWLRSFLQASRKVVDLYLEDEGQLDQVYHYLKQLYDTAPATAPCLANVDRIRFVLDVLVPEAIIHAIAGVDEVSIKKAEEKYLKGPCMSKREREEFDWMIEQQVWSKYMGTGVSCS